MDGSQDVIAVIPVDASWGAVIVWQPYGSLETASIRLYDSVINTISFRFTDAYGRLLPMSPTASVYIQLTFIELETV